MSKIEVDAIDKQSGSTLTLGGSGTAVTLACGATQTGFGRTGTVDWQTGSIKTSTFTAANGEGYFANTSGGAFTMNLPAGTAGNIVSVVDYTNTFQTHNLTLAPNGSQKIGGVAASENLSTEGQSVTFVYVDDTEGWKNVQDSTSNVTGNAFLQASGGTVSCSGNFKIHTFTGPGTFTVSAAAVSGPNNVDYLVVAGGGGGGGRYHGAGGGAGGHRTSFPSPSCNAGAFPVSVQGYPIQVGSGGPAGGNDAKGTVGVNSVFSTITSAGGGFGANYGVCSGNGGAGGSGGGGSTTGGSASGGAGNTPSTPVSQGNNGGTGTQHQPAQFGAGGGGGIGAVGGNGTSPQGGPGGDGVANSITGSPVMRAGGGGGSAYSTNPAAGQGGQGGGGAGTANSTAGAGTDNTGGGGGGAGDTGGTAGAGGSGVVIIRYKAR